MCAIPTVSHCCFYFSLRTGIIVIGYLSIIASIICIILGSIHAAVTTSYVRDVLSNPPPGFTKEEMRMAGAILQALDGIKIALCVIQLVLSIILVFGAHTNDQAFIGFYVVAAFVIFLLGFVLGVVYSLIAGLDYLVLFIISCVTRGIYLAMADYTSGTMLTKRTLVLDMSINNVTKNML